MKRVAGLALAAAGAGLFVHSQARRARVSYPPRGAFTGGLHYREAGFGTAVVMLHGLGAMLEDFELSGLFGLAARDYRAVAFDRPGYGYSERSPCNPFAQAKLLREAFEDLGIVRPVIVAHSLGTQVALAYALEFPQHVRGLVLAAGYYYPSVRPDALMLVPPAIPLVGTLLRHTFSPLIGRVLWPSWLKVLFSPLPVPQYLPAWRALAPEQLRRAGEESAMLVPATIGMRKRYWRIKTPTIIIAGAKDRYVSPSHSRRLHEELRFSTYLEIPEAGHMVHHAAPDAVLRSIRALAG